MGLDIGTSGCKCTWLDENGAVLAAASSTYAVSRSQESYCELNPSEVWSAVKSTIATVLKRPTSVPVKAISISSFGEAVIPVGVDGRVLDSSILYTDIRGQAEAEFLCNQLGAERMMELTGLPVHPMYSITKMMWIKRHRPGLYRRTAKFMQFGDYIAYQLTGLACIDYSLASRTMAFNIRSKAWEPSILAAADIDANLLSKPVSSGDIIGTVHREASEETGLPAGTLVVAGGHDQACAALGAGVIREGQAIDGIGSVECITPAYKRPVLSADMLKYRYNCAPHLFSGMYLSYAFNFTGGSLLQWYKDGFGKAEAIEAERKGISPFEHLNDRAADVPTDLLVIPHFAGSGTPTMNPAAKGVIHGLTLSTEPKHIYRALMEGINYDMLYNLECLNCTGIRVDTLRAVGGGARSALWMQMKADIMNRQVETLHVSEAGTLGVAIQAGVAAGIYRSVEEAVRQLVQVKETFYPDPERAAIYAGHYERYKELMSLFQNKSV
ncbi:L-fuculokinase [Paenibacillus sp. GCM10027626]|uniref:FGGY-family carbohydrate kinase n=1 Tax=Paenibacillus sp. GCM10027626 TaxID=3273411 RepID=UPI003644AA20